MRKILLICTLCLFLSGCVSSTKKEYEPGEAPHCMTVMDSTIGYDIYRHDETGVWYFVATGAYGKGVCVMVNPDGTPYAG